MSRQPQEKCAQRMTTPHIMYLTEQEINLTKTSKKSTVPATKKNLIRHSKLINHTVRKSIYHTKLLTFYQKNRGSILKPVKLKSCYVFSKHSKFCHCIPLVKDFFLERFQSFKEASQMRYLCAFRREQMEKCVEYVRRQLRFLLVLVFFYFVLYLSKPQNYKTECETHII